MAEVEFNYNGKKTTIQCNLNEKIKDIIKKYIGKIEKNVDDIYFLYGGDNINEELTFEKQANSQDKKRKLMSILVNDVEDESIKINTLKKSRNIICPKCKENIRFYENNFKITLQNCKNMHKIENLTINEYEKSQNINESEIICHDCKTDKSHIYNNKLKFCQVCQINLCPLCILKHDKSHYIIDYENKCFICKFHHEPYNSYCQNCKNDICIMCEKEHEGHKIKTYGKIMPDLKNINNNLKNSRIKIDEYKNFLNEIIKKLNNLRDNLEIYYKIYNDIIQTYNIRNRNFILLENMNDINYYLKKSIENLNMIINEKNYYKKMIYTINNYNNIFNKEFNSQIDLDKIEKELDKLYELSKKEEINLDLNQTNEITKFKEGMNEGNNLLEYFLIIGLDPEIYKNDWLYNEDLEKIEEKYKEDIKPKIISHFPPFKKTTVSFDESIISYCFPEGFHLINNPAYELKEKNFSFILPNRDYNEKYPSKYFSCIIFYENISNYKKLYNAKEKYNNNNNNLNIKYDNNKDNQKLNDIYIPKCLLLISLYPQFTMLEKINKEIYKYSLKKNSILIPIERIIENLLIELSAPPRGLYKIEFDLNYESFTLPQNVMNQLPLIDIDLKMIYNNFTENDIIVIYCYILLESKIIFFSKNINSLYQIIYGFSALLYPFEYYYQIITFLPKEELKIFKNSSSFIIGILDNDFDFENYYLINKKALNDCDIIIDIDNKKIKILNKDGKKPEPPKSLKKFFEKQFNDFISQLKQSKNQKTNELFMELFFTLNANLLYNYNEFINFDAYYSKKINNFFNKDKYLKKISLVDKNFYQTLIETQMFKNYLQQKMIPKNSFEMIKVIQFEEKINEITKKFFQKNKNYLKNTKNYEIINAYKTPEPRKLTQLEKQFYNKKENRNELIDYGVIISNDDYKKNEVLFNYSIFPKLKKFSFYNIYEYYLPINYDEEIEKINEDIISKLFVKEKSSIKYQSERYLYLSWICIWAFTFWYCEEKEKNYWFQELIKIIKNSLYYDIKVFNYLFETLNKYGNENMILKLYTILIKKRWNPSLQVYNMAIKIIEKEKENNLLNMVLNKQLDKEYKKKNFNKRVFGSKIDSKILINYEFDSNFNCDICQEVLDLESLYKNSKEIREDSLWIQCPFCCDFLLPKINVKYQEENDENIEIKKKESFPLFSPFSLFNSCLIILSQGINYDVNCFMTKESIFWSSIYFFKFYNLEYEFMLPYYDQIKHNYLSNNN